MMSIPSITTGRMLDFRSLNHTEWECKYHTSFIPVSGKIQYDGPPRPSKRSYCWKIFYADAVRMLQSGTWYCRNPAAPYISCQPL